jgi:hypothetical protein
MKVKTNGNRWGHQNKEQKTRRNAIGQSEQHRSTEIWSFVSV